MIVKKCWYKYKGSYRHTYRGIFLFGIIPLYIVRLEVKFCG